MVYLDMFFFFTTVFLTVCALSALAVRSTSKVLGNARLLPVLHNLNPEVASRTTIDSLYSGLNEDEELFCSVSLRHPSAMSAVRDCARLIRKQNPYGVSHDRVILGISSAVSEMQILDAIYAGAKYISTMYHSKSLLSVAQACGTPMLSGVTSLQGSIEALDDGTDALKFYPSSLVPPMELKSILEHLRRAYGGHFMDAVPIIVAGGVKQEDIGAYIAAGASGFAIGYDCGLAHTIENIYDRVNIASTHIDQVYHAQHRTMHTM